MNKLNTVKQRINCLSLPVFTKKVKSKLREAAAFIILLGLFPLSSTAQIDPLEYPPGHPNVTVSATEQLKMFPVPRFKQGHTFLPNFNWMDPIWFGSRWQSGVSDAQAVTNSVDIQTELAKNFNYYVNVSWNGDNFNTAWKNLANANPQYKVGLITFRAQVGSTPKIWDQTLPAANYLQNSSGQFIDANGSVTSNKVWRPTAPISSYTQDGLDARGYIQSALSGLSRNVDMVNENGEVFNIYSNSAMGADPQVTAAKNSSGLDWETFLAQKVKENDQQAYRDQFMNLSQLSGAKFSEYRMDGHREYNFRWEQMRYISTPINGQYYSTSDFYVRWPNNWKDWQGPWHGLRWMTESRHYEIAAGDKLFSPFIAAGWDDNPEVDVRPAQWLGLLKLLNIYGAEFFYTGFFNESFSQTNPPPNPKGYAWQAVIPAYAQATSTRYEDIMRNGSLLPGDMIDVAHNPDIPYYQFNTGASNKVVAIRKMDTANKYAITGTIQNSSNVIGSTPLTADASITLYGQNLQFKIRRQGSTYIYDNTNTSAPVFYQLDEWHEATHPYRWSQDFNLEAELYDNTNAAYTIKTTVPAGTASGDFRNFTSFITFPDAQTTFTPIEYMFTPRDGSNTTYYLWVKMRSRVNGVTTGLSASVDNANAKIISCASDTLWKWYRLDATNQQAISYSNLTMANHTLRLTPENSKLEIDEVILTTNSNLGLTPAGPTCSTSTCPATVTPNGPLAFCTGGSVVLTASSGTSYLWTPGNQTTQSITVTASGNYSVTVGQSNGCTGTSAPLTVSVSSATTPTITANGPTTFCQGSSVVLTASSGSAYLWSPGGATTQSITVNASGNYSVNVTNVSGCSTTSASTNVTVNSAPSATITAGGPTTFCQGGSVVLTASSGNAYLWSPGGETAQSITVNATGSYTVNVTDASGCSATSASTNITVNSPSPATITAGGPTTFCQGGSVVLTASSGNAYLWSPGGETAQSITVNATGSYTVNVTDASGCSATSASTNITVNSPSPATITAGGPTTFCQGGSVILTASSGSAYLWSPGGETTQSITVNATGSYSVNVTDVSGCSATSASTNITVNSPPSATITAGGPTTFCQGSSVVLMASAGSAYLWSPGGETTQAITVSTPGNYAVNILDVSGCYATSPLTEVIVNPLPAAIISASGPLIFNQGDSVILTSSTGSSYLWSPVNQTTQSITVTASGTYTVLVSDSNGCSAVSDPVTVTVNGGTQEVAVITPGGPLTFCEGGSVTLSANQGINYVWSTGETTQSITANTSGSYVVTVTFTSNISTSTPTDVVVNPLPDANISANGPTTFCQGGSVTLSVSPGNIYLWLPGNQTTQSITIDSSGSYSVSITDSNGCSNTSVVTDVTVNPLPAAIISASGPLIFNQGDSVILTSSTGSSYLWSPVNQTTQSITVTASGTYTVLVSDSNGCSAVSDPVTVTVNGGTQEVAVITPGGPLTFCEGGSVTLSANQGINYVWSTGETTQSITANTSGSYVVTVTFTSNISTSTPTDVVVNPLPDANISANGPTTFCQGGSVTLSVSPGNIYLWLPGNQTTQSITIDSSGSYSVSITDSNGCSATSLSEIVTVTYCDSCPAPAGLYESAVTSDTATLNWDPLAGVDSLQLSLIDLFAWTSISETFSGALSQFNVGVAPGKWYFWRIRSKCGNEFSSWSPFNFFATPSTRLADPSQPTVSKTDIVVPGMSIFPNPAYESATVAYSADHEGTINLQLIDFTGKVVKSTGMALSKGNNKYPLDLRNLPKGIYMIIIEDNGKVNNEKLIVN